MTWPTDLARLSTNPLSPENMITKNLMNQALKTERDRTFKSVPMSDSDSDSDIDSDYESSISQKYRDIEKRTFAKNLGKTPVKTITKSDSERRSLVSKHIKIEPSMKKNSSSLKHIFSCCCIQ